MKVISGDIEPTSGEVNISKGQRIAVLRQDHFAFDDFKVIDTVIIISISIPNPVMAFFINFHLTQQEY